MSAAGFYLQSSVPKEAMVKLPISSLAVAIGDLLELDVGAVAWTAADANTEHWQKKAVAVGSATTSDTEVLAVEVLPGMKFLAQTANNSAAADNGDRMLLTDTNTVNNTGTDNTSEEACVIQIAPVGAASDKQILCEVVYGTGVNPDAA